MFLLAATRISAAAWAAAASSACAAARHELLRQRCASTCTGVQPLADILKLPLLQDKTADEIEHIWLAAHADSSSHVASVMSSEEYGVLAARAIASPLFVLPLRKPPSGFCTLMINWQPGQQQQQQHTPLRALVTTLEEFRAAGPAASSHLVLSAHTELAATHELVLLRGALSRANGGSGSGGVLSAPEARTVLELTRALYLDTHAHHSLVYTFNHDPGRFDFTALCELLGVPRSGGAGVNNT